MYKPKEEELLELGFKEIWFENELRLLGDRAEINYHTELNVFTFVVESEYVLNLTIESIEDIKTLIRLFKLK